MEEERKQRRSDKQHQKHEGHLRAAQHRWTVPGQLAKLLIQTLIFLLATSALIAQTSLPEPDPYTAPEPESRETSIEIYLLTIESGTELDMIWAWWGHTALLVKDKPRNLEIIFDFGLFRNFGSQFLYNYLQGLPVFYLGTTSLKRTLARYKAENRKVMSQRLFAPEPALLRLYEKLLINTRPENRGYAYHHFYNNCTTKVRDIIDQLFNGDLREEYDTVTSKESIRAKAVFPALIWPPAFLLFNSLAGYNVSVPRSYWQGMYLPEDLMQALVLYRNKAPSLAQAKVGPLEVLWESSRGHTKHSLILRWSLFITLLLLWWFMFYVFPLVFHHRTKRLTRFLSSLGWWLWYLPVGLIGLAITYGYFNTGATSFGYLTMGYNFSLHGVHPLFLLLPLGWFFCRGGRRRMLWLSLHSFFLFWAILGLALAVFLAPYALAILLLSCCVQGALLFQVHRGRL